MIRKVLFTAFLSLTSFCWAQEYYSELRRKYWEYEENDPQAFLYLNLYIASAKKEKNYAELFQAYEDAIRYSERKKLHYADSAIAVAKLSGNHDLIANAYMGKGAVYYFNYRRFQPALDEYLKAFEYTKNAENEFLKYQNLYLIGVVKSYLGYYEDALDMFKACIDYFKPYTKANIHPNLLFNHYKGYLNSLHQIIICYQALGMDSKATELIDEGLKEIPDPDTFYLEKSYFQKSKAISEFNRKQYSSAIFNLEKALPGFKKKSDFTFSSIAYSYRGMSYYKLGNKRKALEDFRRVDSIFNKYQFILPYQRSNFEDLINYYKDQNEPEKELYYTKQLLRADSIIATDFKLLVPRIHKEYDTATLLQAKEDLEKFNHLGKYFLIVSVMLIVFLGGFLFYWLRRKKDLQVKYDALLFKMKNTDEQYNANEEFTVPQSIVGNTFKLDEKIIQDLTKKFAVFEKNKGFLEKGVTAGKLASNFGTNATYLSQFMKECKGNNFNAYLNKLRIEYAKNQLYTQKAWRRNSVESIAYDCGFKNRQSFSHLFYEQTGMRPAEFIKKRNDEVERRI